MIILENKAKFENIETRYYPILEKAVGILKSEYRENILEIRLQGSVARNDIVKNVSDLDILCILKNNSNDCKTDKILEYEKLLSVMVDDLTGVDLNLINEELLKNDYGFWLIVCTDSICLYGSNKYYKKKIEIEGHELSKIWNINRENLISDYRNRLSATDETLEIEKISKLTGKDILKSYRNKLMIDFELFDRTIKGTHDLLVKYYKENRGIYSDLLDLYMKPIDDKSKILKVMDEVLLLG